MATQYFGLTEVEGFDGRLIADYKLTKGDIKSNALKQLMNEPV